MKKKKEDNFWETVGKDELPDFMDEELDPFTFKLLPEDIEMFNKWNDEHIKTCVLKDTRCAIGGRLTFSFIPTGIGTAIIVKCACGKEIDLTSNSNW